MKSAGLILIKHSTPLMEREKAAALWRLNSAGRAGAERLVARLAPLQINALFSSYEPKAVETAAIISAHLALPAQQRDGLGEHDRRSEPFTTEAQFHRNVAAFFASPEQLCYGAETAVAANERFEAAVTRILAEAANQTVAIVAHGTVISLFAAAKTGCDPYLLWQQLTLPSYIYFPHRHQMNQAVVVKAI